MARTEPNYRARIGLSVVISIAHGKPDGTDFTWTINRRTDPAAYTETYTSPSPVIIGQQTLSIRFYAQPDGQGTLVGVAQDSVTIDASGNFTPGLSTTFTIASVEVTPGQTIGVGETKDLLFSARDANGAIVPVSPGSVTINLPANPSPGTTFVEVVNGQLHGLAPGDQSLTVTVDGKTSATATVAVTNPVRYSLTVLEPLPGEVRSYAYGINEFGVVVGSSQKNSAPANFSDTATVWLNGVPTALDTPAGTVSVARAIDNVGVIVGETRAESGQTQAVLWNQGVRTNLAMPSGFTSTIATGIQDGNHIVGYGMTSGGSNQALFWLNGVPSGMGLPAGRQSRATAINASGTIVGHTWTTAGSDDVAFVLTNGTKTDLPPLAGYVGSVANGVSPNGTVAGWSYTATGFRRATIWQSGQAIDLGTTASNPENYALDVNDAGGAVGVMWHPTTLVLHGFLRVNGLLFDLNDLATNRNDMKIWSGDAINNAGGIAANGSTDVETIHRALLLTPL